MVACENAPIRICAILVEFCEFHQGRYLILRCFTQNEMANFLSLHKITVAKVIKSLKEAGFIDRSGRSIEVKDRESLKKIVNRQLCIRY